MAVPVSRAIEILVNANKLLDAYRNEIKTGVTQERLNEINRDSKLVMKIVSMTIKPYGEMLKPYIGEDWLKEHGFI